MAAFGLRRDPRHYLARFEKAKPAKQAAAVEELDLISTRDVNEIIVPEDFEEDFTEEGTGDLSSKIEEHFLRIHSNQSALR